MARRTLNPLRYLTRADGRPIAGMPASAVAEMAAACARIRRRTGWQGWYHRPSGTVQFSPGDRGMGGSVSEVVRANGSGGKYLPIDEDRICKMVYSTRIGKSKKGRIIERAAQMKQELLDRRINDLTQEISPELADITKFWKRKSESAHSQRVFVMN